MKKTYRNCEDIICQLDLNPDDFYRNIVINIILSFNKGLDFTVMALDFAEENIDVVINENEWMHIVDSARLYYERIEDYDMCVICRDTLKKITDK